MEWREERVKECGRERGEGELLVKIKEPGGSRGRQQEKPGLKVMLLEFIQGVGAGAGGSKML